MRRKRSARSAAVLGLWLLGCASDAREVAVSAQAVVYGDDDRLEYFELAEPAARARIAESMVALVPRAFIDLRGDQLALSAPSLGEFAGLCPGEAFAEQPAAALCTGVLVDWDLVLTAGHCVHRLALPDLAVVFDYHYDAAGQLAARPADAVDALEIASEAIVRPADDLRVDYAWLRLAEPAAPPHRPAPVYLHDPELAPGAPIVSIGASGGVPLKLDAGAAVRDPRRALADYFVADTDTAAGSSGGAAFDDRFALIGILARGGSDWADTPAGCRTAEHEPDAQAAKEQFTYAHRAVAGLCAEDPGASSLCSQQCDGACEAAPPDRDGSSPGCSAGARRSGAGSPGAGVLLLVVCVTRRRTFGGIAGDPVSLVPKSGAGRTSV